MDIEVIQDKEQKVVAEFYDEIKHILKIDDLYEGCVIKDLFNQFILRIKKLIEARTGQFIFSAMDAAVISSFI